MSDSTRLEYIRLCTCSHPVPTGWPCAQPTGTYQCVKCDGWRR